MAEHGVAGVLGLIVGNAFFASSEVIGYDGYTDHPGGWYDQNWKQMYKQLAYVGAVTGYCVTVTTIICFVLNRVPGLKMRASEEGEQNGMDEDQIGEFAYDYVEVRRNFFDLNLSKLTPVNGELVREEAQESLSDQPPEKKNEDSNSS
ncbi:hypothetical protein KL905_001846 [Ogataea polymorpha]|nr:hypothetical protein KL937_000316 [Ogataea polymorpha]KAG7895830.1 hypothetical protein KL936_000538 [Ogataea polymorpha]KAG7896293.1 hypothetical protein KL908_000807 [Ogataea polymorpha]KAG7908406.1 hypothetical protein KL907_001896 [Ogataea polymorpha]KAG7908864.1 hypothetical protein KL906_003095 [Ogataea polymorpha]